MWALDYQFDVTATGRTVKILHIVDEFTRESLTDVVGHSIDADATVAALDKVAGARGTQPEFVRCDNGPELTANAPRDWCRFTGTGTSYIDPGSAWQNPWVGSYGGRMRDELLAVEQFDSLLEAQVLVDDWRIEYNTYRPRHADACRVRRAMADQPTTALIAGGPKTGVRSVACRPFRRLRQRGTLAFLGSLEVWGGTFMRRAGILLAVLVLSTVLGAPEAHADPGAGGLSGVLDLRLTPGYDTNPTIMTTQDWTATDVLVTGELASIGAFVGPVKVDVIGNEGGTLITSQGVLNGIFSGHVEGLLFGSGDFFSEYTRVGSVVVGTASGHFSVCAGTGTCTTTTSLSAFAGGVIAGVIVPKTTGPIDAVLFTGALVLAGT